MAIADTVGIVIAAHESGTFTTRLKKQKLYSLENFPLPVSPLIAFIDDLDRIVQMLAKHEDILSAYSPPVDILQCQRACDAAVLHVGSACTELDSCVKRSRWFETDRFVLKEGTLERLKQLLARAAANLLYAQSVLHE